MISTETYLILKTFVERLVQLYKNAVPSASGKLRNSVSGSVLIQDGGYVATLNLDEVWKYVEDGRRPGKFPPISEISKWINVKPVTPQPYTLPSGRTYIPSEKQLSFLISRSISRNGITPRPILENSIESLKTWLLANLTESIKLDVSNLIKIM